MWCVPRGVISTALWPSSTFGNATGSPPLVQVPARESTCGDSMLEDMTSLPAGGIRSLKINWGYPYCRNYNINGICMYVYHN